MQEAMAVTDFLSVGAFHDAMEELRRLSLVQPVLDAAEASVPILGLCLGMQLMFQTSEEGNARGLGILPGRVRRFEQLPGLKIPHMGWNRLDEANDVHLETGEYYYFVHSFYCEPEQAEITAAVSRHGCQFTAAVRQNNVLLTQFHPEKSGDSGLRLLSSWLSKEVNL
jgi:glutamine amidotransferase